MASYTKFQIYVEDVNHGVHDLSSDQLVVALTNSAPTVATDGQLSDITEISYVNCSSRNVTTSASSQASGTYKLVCDDLTLTASGGSVGPFRYIVLYNDDAANDELIAYWDYGSNLTLNNGESLLLDFDGTNGVFQMT